jgi:hypothetical protein
MITTERGLGTPGRGAPPRPERMPPAWRHVLQVVARQTMVSEEVAQRADGFSYEDMGPVTLKGVTAPMRLFRAAR